MSVTCIHQHGIDEKEAVRYFALTMAEKLLKDRELNQAAPFLVDKIIRMLINESRCP